MKKILLLGGSAQQVVAIKTAKEMGFYTILCDYLPDNPGQFVADKYYNASTTDIEAVYKIAKEEKVDGILPYASDPAALPAAIVCERLGLPTNPAKSVEILGVKHKFREFLKNNNFACPKAYSFNVSDDINSIINAVSNFNFPIVVKPTDSSGSKGITKLQTTKDLIKAIEHANEYSRNKILIAEEFIEREYPNVIGGDIFVHEGKIILHGEMDCLRENNGAGLIPIGKKPLECNPSQIKNIYSELQRLVSALEIKFGEMNVEILLGKNNLVHFLELGPRAGGNMIPIQLSDAFDVDLVKANVATAMGIEPELKITKKEGCFFTYVLHSNHDGVFNGIQYSKEIESFIYRKVIYKKLGVPIESFDGAGKALGILFLHTKTIEQMNYFCENMEKLIKLL